MYCEMKFKVLVDRLQKRQPFTEKNILAKLSVNTQHSFSCYFAFILTIHHRDFYARPWCTSSEEPKVWSEGAGLVLSKEESKVTPPPSADLTSSPEYR